MPASQPPKSTPLDTAREAFEPLSTPDKTAFVFQATFDTIGQAISETGKAFADLIHQMGDSLGSEARTRPPSPPASASPEPPVPVPPRPRKPRRPE